MLISVCGFIANVYKEGCIILHKLWKRGGGGNNISKQQLEKPVF